MIFLIAESNELFTALRQRDPLLVELKSRFGCNTSVGSMFPIVSRAFRVVTQRKGETLSLSLVGRISHGTNSQPFVFCVTSKALGINQQTRPLGSESEARATLFAI